MKKNATITRTEIADDVSAGTKIAKSEIAFVLNEILDCIVGHMKAGRRVELRGVGVFDTVVRKAVIRRNPHKPEDLYEIPAHRKTYFKSSVVIRSAVRKLPLPSL